MTEEVKQEGGEPSAPQYTEIEQKAMELGWRPKEEFDGEDDKFVEAKEFVERQPLYEKIAALSKQNKSKEKALQAFQQHLDKVSESAYKKALDEIKAQQKKAVAEGDLETYAALDEKKDEIKQEQQRVVEEAKELDVSEPQVDPRLQAWVARNSWFETQPHMRVFAESVGSQYAIHVQSGRMAPEDVLKEIERQVRKEFPERFRNPNKDKPSAVEGVSGGNKSTASDKFELSDDERRIMNTVINTRDKDGKPYITKEQYIAQLQATRKT